MQLLTKSVAGIALSATLISTLALTGCTHGGSSNASDGNSLTFSGTLATSQSASVNSNQSMDIDTGNLKIQATAFTEPPTTVTADVGSDGKFTLTIPNAKGKSTSAAFLDKSDNSQVGVIVFEDATKKDMNGNAAQTSSVALNANLDLGAISLGTDGKVKIPVSSIADKISSSSTVAAATAFDPTGTWYMKAFTGTVPAGYQTVGATCGDGPCIGFPITLIRFAGKTFTANPGACDNTASPVVCDPTTNGAVGNDDRYALSIWGESFANSVGQCGAKTGFTAAEARAAAGLHLTTLPSVSGNAITFGPYAYNHATGFGGDASPFNKDWMKTGATNTHTLQDCRPTAISSGGNSYNGWACRAKVMTGMWPGTPVAGPVYGWQVGVDGGGCFNTATNKAVNVTNWSAIGNSASCVTTDVSSTYGPGFAKTVCTYANVDHDGSSTTAPIGLSCTNIGAQVTNSSGAPTSTPLTLTSGQYLGQPEQLAATGAPCSTIGHADDAHTLAAYRCYAEAYWSGGGGGGASCTRDYNFNWSATTPQDFAKDSGRGKPKNAFITNILNYSPDGQMATLEDEQVNTITINTGASSSTFCKASHRTVISFKKVSATRLLIDIRESGQMNSTNAACVGAAKDALAGKNVGGGDLESMLTPQNMIFYADTTL